MTTQKKRRLLSIYVDYGINNLHWGERKQSKLTNHSSCGLHVAFLQLLLATAFRVQATGNREENPDTQAESIELKGLNQWPVGLRLAT